MKIGLAALQYHACVLQMYLQLLDAAGVEVVLFTTKELFREIRAFFGERDVPACDIRLLSRNDPFGALSMVAAASSELDRIVFTEFQFSTVEQWRHFLSLRFACPLWCGIHHAVDEPGRAWVPPWRPGLSSQVRLRQAAYARCSGYVVHSEPMRANLQPWAGNKPVCFLPVSFRDPDFRRNIPSECGTLTMTITGAVAAIRRDYELVLDAVESIRRRGANVQLVLAGSANSEYARAVIGRAGAINRQLGPCITWFEHYVGEELFRHTLETTQLLVTPLVKPPPLFLKWFKRYGLKKEYALGRNVTAATYDAVRFQLPIIYPAFYANGSPPHPGSLIYWSKRDLIRIMYRLYTEVSALADVTRDMAGYAARFVPESFVPQIRSALEATPEGGKSSPLSSPLHSE